MASTTSLCFNHGKFLLPFTATKFIPSSKRPIKSFSFSSISCSPNTPQSTIEPKSQMGSTPNVVKILEERGLLESITNENLRLVCSEPTVATLKVYCGFDPTAESLHLENLLGLIVLYWSQRCGHKVVALIGEATGRIGEPSGKSQERPKLDLKTLKNNIDGIMKIINKILSKNASLGSEKDSNFVILNNYDWWKEVRLLDFLKQVGRHARVGSMMSKESVKKRLESEQGLSYTEFTYQLLRTQIKHSYHTIERCGACHEKYLKGKERKEKKKKSQMGGQTWPINSIPAKNVAAWDDC